MSKSKFDKREARKAEIAKLFGVTESDLNSPTTKRLGAIQGGMREMTEIINECALRALKSWSDKLWKVDWK